MMNGLLYIKNKKVRHCMSLKSDQRMEVWIFYDAIPRMIWLRFLLVHGESGNPGIYGKDKTDQAVSFAYSTQKKMKIFPQIVLSCTAESLDVILLPGILFVLTFICLVDVIYFCFSPLSFLQASRLIAVFHDSGMEKAIMTASSLHT